jgi:GNAT superfamily N-acetyltransferase
LSVTNVSLSFTELPSLNSAPLAQILAIYEEAFPPHQRVPFDELIAGARKNDRLFVVVTDAADPVGFAALSQLKSVGCAFVEYFAVARHRRSRGIGGGLWEGILRTLEERHEPLRLVLEVEDPEEPGIAAEKVEFRCRRIRFWERCGARLLADHGYVMPDLGGGTEPLRVMWADPITPRAAQPSGDKLFQLIRALYVDGYGLPEDHPLVVRFRLPAAKGSARAASALTMLPFR